MLAVLIVPPSALQSLLLACVHVWWKQCSSVLLAGIAT